MLFAKKNLVFTGEVEWIDEPVVHHEKIKKQIADRVTGGRYRAVNLSKRDTIEFRNFASTTSVFELRLVIEFIEKLVAWSNLPEVSYDTAWSVIMD